MHFIPLAVLAATLPFAFTAPFYASNTTNATTPGSLQGEYYLMTSVIGDGFKNKDKLYVSGYHTGAGLNDVVLGDIDTASKGFINDTHQQFDYNTSFPWALQMGGDTNYAGESYDWD